MGEAAEKIGSSLLNLILGGLILWVGQTTFRHAGILATLDEKFASINEHYENLRSWQEKIVSNIKDDSRNQFTIDDAEKLSAQLKKLDDWTYNVERRLSDRVTELEVKLSAVEARGQDARQVSALQAEVAQLRLAMTQNPAPQAAEYSYQTASNGGASAPVYLPPVNSRR